MPLILSRAEGRSVYLGRNLNPKSFHSTFDTWVRVERIEERDWEVTPKAELRLAQRIAGEISFRNVLLTWEEPDLKLDVDGEEVTITLLGITSHNRPDGSSLLNTSLGITAPRDINIIRDNSKKG